VSTSPRPWRWSGDPLEYVADVQLQDDNGDVVLEARMGTAGLPVIHAASAYVREIVAAAPDLAALVREAGGLDRWTCGQHEAITCPAPQPDGRPCYEHRRRALLKRLDEARKAGG